MCPFHSLREDRSADNWIFNTYVSIIVLFEGSGASLNVPQVVLLIICYCRAGVNLFAFPFLSVWIWFQKAISDKRERDFRVLITCCCCWPRCCKWQHTEYTLPYNIWNDKNRIHYFYCDVIFLWAFSEQACLKATIVVFSKDLSIIFNYRSSACTYIMYWRVLWWENSSGHIWQHLTSFYLSCQLPLSHSTCLSFRSIKRISKQNPVSAETLTSSHACRKCIFFHHPFLLM